jgi:hypothetical protein
VSPGIPDVVQQLLQGPIASVRQLDMLLLMHQAGEGRTWSAAELETALRSSYEAVDADLAGLLQAGLIAVIIGPPTLWRYTPGTHRATIEALAGYYRTHRTSVVRLIASKPNRQDALDTFADAFRLRRREHDDG